MASSSSSSSPEFSAAPTATTSQYAHLTREEVLEELSSRFILNLPEEELASLERVCFQVEQAHWYYEDFIREQNSNKFPSYNLRTFSEALFKSCPLLQQWANDHDRAFQSFMQYKTRVPVCGAIMLNDTWEKVLLVKGWKSSAGWGFPKGKINEQEPRPRCAAREVLEETGYDLERQIVPKHVIELSIKEQSISLYIVPGVPEDYPFQTRTRKEISQIAWFRLSDLPTWRRSKSVPGKFYLITPFIGPLKSFMHSHKPHSLGRKPRKAQNVQVIHDVQLSSEDDNVSTLQFQSSVAIGHDANAQESSSQSSSADNGEPQTPSPQYSAPRINHSSPGGLSRIAEESSPGQRLDLDNVDPQLARLLSSLSMSASVPPEAEMDKFGSFTSPDQLLSNPTNAQPLPAITAVPIHPSVQGPPDLSSVIVSTSVLQNSASHPSVVHSLTSRLDPPSSSQLLAHTPFVSSPLQEASSSAISPRVHARRSSATADISPYLPRARNVPAGKEMRYISMLENVAKESDRTASFPPPMGPPSHSGMPLYGARPSMAPVPAASVSPMMMSTYGTRNELPAMYSSPSVASPQALPLRPPTTSNISFVHGMPGDDPFTVRPHTSNHFHVIPPQIQTRQGMYPDPSGLMGLANPGAPPMAIRQPPFGPLHPGQFNPPPMQMNVPPRDPQNAFHMMSPNFLPPPNSTLGQPLSPISPMNPLLARNNASRAANNAHLLSILNAPSTTAARVGPIMVTPNVRGVGPR